MNQLLDHILDLSFHPRYEEKSTFFETNCRTWFQGPKCILEELVEICEGIFTAKHLFEEVLAPAGAPKQHSTVSPSNIMEVYNTMQWFPVRHFEISLDIYDAKHEWTHMKGKHFTGNDIKICLEISIHQHIEHLSFQSNIPSGFSTSPWGDHHWQKHRHSLSVRYDEYVPIQYQRPLKKMEQIATGCSSQGLVVFTFRPVCMRFFNAIFSPTLHAVRRPWDLWNHQSLRSSLWSPQQAEKTWMLALTSYSLAGKPWFPTTGSRNKFLIK